MKPFYLKIGLSLCLLLSFVACQQTAEQQLSAIEQLESQINAQSSAADIEKLEQKYYLYVTCYPADSLAPEMLFRAGTLHLKTNKGHEAIAVFDRLVQEYPDFAKNGEACFYKAFTYENILMQLDSAKIAYEYFIHAYPEDNLVTDAQLCLQYLGMSAEEIVATFNLNDEDTLLKKESSLP